MSEKLEPKQKRNLEFFKPCFLEKIRKNWSLKFGRTGVDLLHIVQGTFAINYSTTACVGMYRTEQIKSGELSAGNHECI